MNAPVRSDSLSRSRTSKGSGLILVGALLSLGCGSGQDVALYPIAPEQTAPNSASRFPSPERISTAEEEADGYWSSTYGNPRPKLTQTLSLGTSDLPVSAPPASPAASQAGDPALPTSSNVTQVSATAIVVVPSVTRWGAGWERPPHARRLDSSQSPKHTYRGAPPKSAAPAPPSDGAESSTKRTSIVAPAVPRAFHE